MKILLIDNSSLTPKNGKFFCEVRTGNFAKDLVELGNDVTMYGQSIEKLNTVHAFDILNNGIKVCKINRKSNKLINYILLYLRIIPLIIKADFVYIFYPSAFKYVAVLCFFLRKPYGLYIRGQNDLNSKFSKLIFKKASLIFTVTNFFTNFVKKLNFNSHTIRPMISLNEKDIVRNRIYKPKESYRILFLARMAKEKGVDELLYAIKQLNEKKYNFTLELVGDGEYLPEAIKLIKSLKIESVVNVRGAVLDAFLVKELYLGSDIYILPTYHEGFPRTLYEAMIFGTPIITTFVGGISGIMKHQHNCLEIKPKSVDSIVSNLIYSFENYNNMGVFARNALSTVEPIIDSSRISHAKHLDILINGK
ncbi:glycosyltransferase family 4 protein [Acinetobacter indicus]|uniref:glycosyltransferase family 4 protein n=1 Tax=Acinetobacter indicus TaxID=756892 RepID=UPI002577D920|nr:glycosyltransferase family 4 protein [Acinetobacter indicus]MDM1301953.1 glycosyltransferase family 4 protein [Acinetobacter indicus]